MCLDLVSERGSGSHSCFRFVSFLFLLIIILILGNYRKLPMHYYISLVSTVYLQILIISASSSHRRSTHHELATELANSSRNDLQFRLTEVQRWWSVDTNLQVGKCDCNKCPVSVSLHSTRSVCVCVCVWECTWPLIISEEYCYMPSDGLTINVQHCKCSREGLFKG